MSRRMRALLILGALVALGLALATGAALRAKRLREAAADTRCVEEWILRLDREGYSFPRRLPPPAASVVVSDDVTHVELEAPVTVSLDRVQRGLPGRADIQGSSVVFYHMWVMTLRCTAVDPRTRTAKVKAFERRMGGE